MEIGGNIEMASTIPKIAIFPLNFNLARAYEVKEPMLIQKIVVQDATKRLFRIILANGTSSNTAG